MFGGDQGGSGLTGGLFFLRNSTSRGGIKRNRGSAFIILKGVKCIVRIWTARFLEFYVPFCICAGSSLAENGPIKILRETLWQFTGRKWAHKKIKRNPRLSESDRRGFSLNLFRGPRAPNAQGNALQRMSGGRWGGGRWIFFAKATRT